MKVAGMHNLEALESTLAALADAGRLEPVDDALVALCRSTAGALDGSPARASLVKEYRESLLALLERTGEKDTDGFADLLAGFRAEVGDSPPV